LVGARAALLGRHAETLKLFALEADPNAKLETAAGNHVHDRGAILPEAMAWRALFAVGLLPALLVLWIRRSIPESEAFLGQRNSNTS
jgi:hypothetical protein